MSKKGNIESLLNFKIAETDGFSKKISKREFRGLYRKIESYVYPQLKTNPFFGLNIKKLKGELSEFYRYRIRDYRLFYTIDSNKVIVFMIDIDHRKNVYKKR